MQTSQTAEMVPIPPLVQQVVSTESAIKHYKQFEELKTKLLGEDDYQKIGDKNFIKKSGWRKLALVFNVSDQIVEKKKESRDDGSFIWSFTVRAIAPNGRFAEAVASCDSRERKFAHTEHDVFATGHTRSKSRAISDLIGAGEASAEEIEGTEEAPASPPSSAKPVGGGQPQKPKQQPLGEKAFPEQIPLTEAEIEELRPLVESSQKIKWFHQNDDAGGYDSGKSYRPFSFANDSTGFARTHDLQGEEIEAVRPLVYSIQGHGGEIHMTGWEYVEDEPNGVILRKKL